MKNKLKLRTRLTILILSFILSSALFLSVSTVGDQEAKKWLTLSTSTDGVYVIDNPMIDYRYDKTKYEVVPFISEPYVVIKGDKQLINVLKMTGKPEFFIELSGKLPGTYREKVSYKGINKNLKVEVYPSIVDLRLMEQQTIKIKPTIELTNLEGVNKNYIVSVPELQKEEVLIRDIQDKLNQVGKVEGVVDVKNMTKTQEVDVTLTVYDRDGNVMKDINLIDKTIKVKIPIERKVTVIKEEVINEIVIVEGVNKQPEDEKEPPKETQPPKQPTQPTKPNTEKPVQEQPKREGILSFINIPANMTLSNHTSGIKWSSDVKIDLKDFKEGKYEMTINDNNTRKVVKFDLILKEDQQETNQGEPQDETDGDTEDKPEEPKNSGNN